MITSIVPIRAFDFEFYAERLRLRHFMDLSSVETLVIDDGSPLEISAQLEELCKELGFVYRRIDSESLPFSLSRARNAGIDYASKEWIVMEDADIVYQYDFYKRIEQEVEWIDDTPFNFLTIPVVYLKDEITKEVFEEGLVDRFIPKILAHVQFEAVHDSGDNQIVESFSPATALFVVRKKLLKRIGGYDEYFVGWGGEDRDIAFRMLAVNKKIEFLPKFFQQTKAWNLNKTIDYEGWRALYRLTGDYLMNKGLYGYHLYHPKLEWREKHDTKKNISFAKEKALRFYEKSEYTPRVDLNSPVQIIIGNNPHLINDYVLNLFDNVEILSDDRNVPFEIILEKIKNYPNVEFVLFWNQYGTLWKLNLCQALKELGYKVIVAERGALPDSFYFDAGGFCIESESYGRFLDVVKSNDLDFEVKKENVLDYIQNLRHSTKALEKQSERIPVGLLRLRLGIEDSKKILFCPLQLSTDTVTNYYIEGHRTYQSFLNELKSLELSLPDDWVLVVKNHPLSTSKYVSPKALDADNFHVHDLIEASDAVVLFNSGCGVLSMAFEKKVFYYGKCFYAIDGVNAKFESAQTFVDILNNDDLSVDVSKVIKFFYFLLYHFYSFAEVEKEIKTRGDQKVNVLKRIFFKSICFPDRKRQEYNKPLSLSSESILLDRYQKALYIAKNSPQTAIKKQQQSEVKEGPIKKVIVEPKVKRPVVLSASKFIISPFLGSKKKAKLKERPHAFFSDSSNAFLRGIGSVIFSA